MRKEMIGWKFAKDTTEKIYPKSRLCLDVLKQNGGVMTVHDIAVALKYSGTPATFKAVDVVLYRLKKDGLVEPVSRLVEGPVKKEMRKLTESSKAVQTWMKRLLTDATKERFLFLFQKYFQWVKEKGLFETPDQMLEDKQRANNDGDRAKHVSMIEDYLNETKLSVSQKKSTYSAVRSFYKHNKAALPPYPLRFKENGNGHVVAQEPVTLDKIRQLLTAGKPREKAMFLIMFQGGMDRSTFTKSFNLEAWPQICKQLGSENSENWDVSRAPIRVDLVRVKTGNPYYAFISVDALKCLQNWMNVRETLTGEPMRAGLPIFITARRDAVTKAMISNLFHRLAVSAGLEARKYGKASEIRYRFHPHELRDTFRSVCTMAGVANPVAEFLIGHEIDRLHYDKSPKTYPEHYRTEYMKLEKYVNVFSSETVGAKKLEELEQKLAALEEENRDLKQFKENGVAKQAAMEQTAQTIEKLLARVSELEKRLNKKT